MHEVCQKMQVFGKESDFAIEIKLTSELTITMNLRGLNVGKC